MDKAVFLGATRELAALGEQQHNRLLRLEFPNDDKPEGAILLANKLVAHEGLSRDFRFEVGVLSDDARIPLKKILGKMVTISLVREDGSLRYFNGYVTEFRLIKADGGYAWYAMVLEPWLAFARLRKNSAVFLERTVIEITEETFKQYRQNDWKLALYNEYEPLSCAIQYQETDHNHLYRRWEDLGLHTWYEHRADGHTLWISDMTQMAEPIEPGGNVGLRDEIPFRRNAGSGEADGIHEWQAVRQAGSSSSTVGGFDYKRPRPQAQTRSAKNEQGNVPPFEVFEGTGGYAFASFDAGDKLAKRRMEEIDARMQFFEARGNDRTVQPGRSFRLGGHFSGGPRLAEPGEPAEPSIERREYLILSVVHEASNNYQAGPGGKSNYECAFTCIRKDIPWRPGRGFNSKTVVMAGVQTAIVVGPPGSDIHTDEYGRVKVQFHWDREGKNNGTSSAWVRVASVWAGGDQGFMAVPRIGQEVAVQFVAGNPDHPLIIGRVFNRDNLPPWKLNGQQALSGLRSRELAPGGGNAASGRSNHLILDDTHGQIQAQLKSDHQHSQLSLGYITRIEDNRGRTDARGEGWELRTDGHGVARAAEGMLITTERRTGAQSPLKDMGETAQRLRAAQDLHDAIATAALQAQAQENGQQHDVADALQAQNDAIRGTGEKFPELTEPHLVLASPAGIETTSAQSTHIASGQHTALTTGRSLSIATGDSFFASVKETFRLFVHKAGMKLVTAAGKITVQAQSDDIEIIANKVLSLISQSDWIELKGKKGIRLHGSESMVEVSDLVQVFTSKPVLFHGNLETLGPQNRPHPTAAAQPRIEPTPEQLYFQLQSHALDGGELANVPYSLYQGETKIEDGVTDEFGGVTVPHKAGTANYSVQLATGDRLALNVVPQFARHDDPQHREQTATNSGLRGLEATIEKLATAKNSTAARKK
jgi:type VI secretion system secreted protein VgrG